MSTVISAILFILPIANHVRIFLDIRRHNSQMHDAVSGQNLSVIFRREKKVAIDMLLVIAVLMLCLAPGVAISIFKRLLNDQYDVLYVWSTTLFINFLFINSSINQEYSKIHDVFLITGGYRLPACLSPFWISKIFFLSFSTCVSFQFSSGV